MCVAIMGEVELADKANDTWQQASLFRNLTCYSSTYCGTNLCVHGEINEVNRIWVLHVNRGVILSGNCGLPLLFRGAGGRSVEWVMLIR